jgi:hypothetical protein
MNETYLALRDQALRTTSATAGQPPGDPTNEPFGVVTDLAFRNGSATVVAMIGGDASIYLSNGGGYIGGAGHDAIKKAARQVVQASREAVAQMRETKEYPLPQPDRVLFYVLTRGGIMSASAEETELENSSQPLSKLYEAVQGVLTQYRLINT